MVSVLYSFGALTAVDGRVTGHRSGR